eukprot:scaffold985_cov573-Prasinococcus_capsulatus_cf.AAC.1
MRRWTTHRARANAAPGPQAGDESVPGTHMSPLGSGTYPPVARRSPAKSRPLTSSDHHTLTRWHQIQAPNHGQGRV